MLDLRCNAYGDDALWRTYVRTRVVCETVIAGVIASPPSSLEGLASSSLSSLFPNVILSLSYLVKMCAKERLGIFARMKRKDYVFLLCMNAIGKYPHPPSLSSFLGRFIVVIGSTFFAPLPPFDNPVCAFLLLCVRKNAGRDVCVRCDERKKERKLHFRTSRRRSDDKTK